MCNVVTMIVIFNVAGHQLSVFNSQAQIQIGGKWNHAKQRVERPFSGVMAGLVFNGLRLLDLASEKDGRTSVRGDVQLLTGIRDRQHEPLQRMQQVGLNIYYKYSICLIDMVHNCLIVSEVYFFAFCQHFQSSWFHIEEKYCLTEEFSKLLVNKCCFMRTISLCKVFYEN